MSENDDFYKKFNSDSSKSRGNKSNIFVPFISGVLGAILVIGLVFGVPNIRKSLVTYNPNNSSVSNSNQSSNNGVVDFVSLNNYSDTAVFAASKVLPSIVGIKVEYTVTSNFMRFITNSSSRRFWYYNK